MDFGFLKNESQTMMTFVSNARSQSLQMILGWYSPLLYRCYRFLLTFTISEHDCGVSHLNVVETNSFKHLTHLSLKFLLGNDVDVKKYLAGCLTSLKVPVTQLLRSL